MAFYTSEEMTELLKNSERFRAQLSLDSRFELAVIKLILEELCKLNEAVQYVDKKFESGIKGDWIFTFVERVPPHVTQLSLYINIDSVWGSRLFLDLNRHFCYIVV